MMRAAGVPSFALCLLAFALPTGCAAPGDPVARHPAVPVAVTDLVAREYGNAFALTFTLPTKSMDRENLPEHPAIEIYRAALAPGASPDKMTAWRLAYSIPSEQVDPYLKGQQVEFHDPLTAEDLARPEGSSLAYKVRTAEVKARTSGDSNVVAQRIYPAPEAPQDVRVETTEPALVVSWTDAPTPTGASSRVYRIYRGELEAGQTIASEGLSKTKLKSPPEAVGNSTTTEYRDTHFVFGASYVYTVRSVAQFGADSVESADSAPAAMTPRDVFPPATPTGLEISVNPATHETPTNVELSWAISSEGDLAGYAVYRSEAEDMPGDRMNTETLRSPTFRDMAVSSGARYYYRVSAIDRAGNESPKSPAVVADVP